MSGPPPLRTLAWDGKTVVCKLNGDAWFPRVTKRSWFKLKRKEQEKAPYRWDWQDVKLFNLGYPKARVIICGVSFPPGYISKDTFNWLGYMEPDPFIDWIIDNCSYEQKQKARKLAIKPRYDFGVR